jgi:hypothetical protein
MGGAPTEARSLRFNAEAAILRTALWGAKELRGTPWNHMARELEHRLRHSDKVTSMARQADRHRRRIATTIHQRINNAAAKGITADSIRENIFKDTQLRPTQEACDKWEKGTQRTIHRLLLDATACNPTSNSDGSSIYLNLKSWPRVCTDRCMNRFKCIMQHVAPRVAFTWQGGGGAPPRAKARRQHFA